MTKENIFCYSKKYNDEDSFKQERFRAFNKKVSENRYSEILNEVHSIFSDLPRVKLSDFWKSVTNKHWIKLLKIPEAKDFKEGFEFISGQEININSCNGKIVEIDGKKFKLLEV